VRRSVSQRTDSTARAAHPRGMSTRSIRCAVGRVVMGVALAAVVLAPAGCQSARDTTAPGAKASTATARTLPAAPGTSHSGALTRAQAAVRTAFVSSVADSSGAVVLVRDGKDAAVLVHGLADVAGRRALTVHDRFPVASLTKSMVATAVLQFVASGRVALDDPVNRYLPGIVPSDRITIRQLLSHRSGLHDLSDVDVAAVRPLTYRALLKASAARLDFEPGAFGVYSNQGYTVLGLLVEKLSGTTLAQALQQRVFAPAGMTSSTLAGTPTVLGYSAYRIGQPADRLPLGVMWASGGVVSTVQDVDRFYTELFAGTLLPVGLVREMEKPTGTSPFGSGDYGLGLWIGSLSCGSVIGHGGSIPGFNVVAWATPDHTRAVVAMVNSDNNLMANNLADSALCG
jgi:D-alanyl-D-alanine carboxypeptidase